MEPNASNHKELDAELVRLVDKTGSLLPRRRKAARQALLDRGEEAVESLLALFDQEKRQYAQRRRSYERTALCLVVPSLILALPFMVLSVVDTPYVLRRRSDLLGGVLSVLLLLLIGSLGVGSVIQARTRRLKATAAALALFDDLRVVGPLAEALEIKDNGFLIRYDLYMSVTSRLMRLLPRLHSKDASRLDDIQRACLHRALNSSDSEFIITILNALAYIGDGNALPYVRRLTNGAVWTPNGKRIRTAAQECLPPLLARAEQERAQQTLLRAANTPATPADVLLRPVAGNPAATPDQLLRASLTDDSPIG